MNTIIIVFFIVWTALVGWDCERAGKIEGKQEACENIYTNLYKQLDIKNLDQDSLKKYCKSSIDNKSI